MRFAQFINGVLVAYPLSEAHIRLAYPQTALPADLTNCALLSEQGYVIVADSDKPTYDTDYQEVLEIDPVTINGIYQQAWQVQDKDLTLANQQAMQRLEYALMQKIADTVRAYHYDDIAEVGVYASTPNTYNTEAQAIVAWAAECWVMFYGLATPISVDTFMSTLPELVL